MTSDLLILASGSSVRARLLSNAGVSFEIEPADIDEAGAKRSLRAGGANAGQQAHALARQKADVVSTQHPQALVIGADQILTCGDQSFDKPADRAEAKDHLKFLSGKTHELASAVVFARAGAPIWHQTDVNRMHMHPLTEAFIDDYLDQVGDAILSSVGCYHLEGLGASLFDRVEGDFFSILGLPLIAVLNQLRREGMLAS